MKPEDQARNIQKVIAKAWMDEGFKQRLLADPATTLKKEGVETSPGAEVRVVEDTDKVNYLVLPMKPSSAELSDEALRQVSGGDDSSVSECISKGASCPAPRILPQT